MSEVKGGEWTNHELGEIFVKEDVKLVVQVSRKGDGEPFLTLREWWLPSTEPEYRPTKKGVTISGRDMSDFMDMMGQVKEFIDYIPKEEL